MSDFYSNNELRHFGVKGMRWGHRKASIASTQPHKRIPGMVVMDESQPKPRRIPGMVVKDESQPKPRINIPKTHIKETNSQTKKISTGKKVAAGVLAGLGVTVTVEAIANRKQVKEAADWVRVALAARKL